MANQAPAANQSNWFEVTASGPLSTENPGNLPLEDWLPAEIGPADIRDFATFTTLALPAGVTVRMHLLIPNGDAMHEAAYYAIDTGEGLALLTLKGRAEDFVTMCGGHRPHHEAVGDRSVADCRDRGAAELITPVGRDVLFQAPSQLFKVNQA